MREPRKITFILGFSLSLPFGLRAAASYQAMFYLTENLDSVSLRYKSTRRLKKKGYRRVLRKKG
jgi:hypothetical protein